jgi:hypothetical protein
VVEHGGFGVRGGLAKACGISYQWRMDLSPHLA